MKITLFLSASLLALSGIASAQTAVEITDPAKIAEIERHAQQLGAQPMAATPLAHPHGDHMGRGDRMHRKHMRKHAREMCHHKNMHRHGAPMRPAPDMPAPPPPT
ncbi:hypothetical protein [Massilia sp. DWR3-1-1]|uniref:hypothetical protein n=1 Tax=Massilia sp. DWR3-1-1 TaxID=2804559 RepID=UPI003CEB5F49